MPHPAIVVALLLVGWTPRAAVAQDAPAGGGDPAAAPRVDDVGGTNSTPPALSPPARSDAPTATLSVVPSSGTAPLAVIADASVSSAARGLVSFAFDWGDGTEGTGEQREPIATHTYASPGTFTASVTVKDAAGETSGASVTVVVGPFGETPAPASQEAAPERTAPPGAVRVFVDCASCDLDFIRSEIPFVDYVRDARDAEVHVLVSTQATGGGGLEYTVRFLGVGRFQGVGQLLRYAAASTDTADERRRGVTRTLKLGLVRYVAETPLGARLAIGFDAARTSPSAAVRDPWDYWVFRTRLSSHLSGQKSTSQTSLTGSFDANRTTERWRIDLGFDGDYSRQRFDVGAGENVTTDSRTLSSRGLVARTLAAHWSAGAVANAMTSTFLNYRLRTRTGAALEYSVFPYSESTRRILTILYTAGVQTLAYREETLFGHLHERRPDHRLEATLGLTQPWGTASMSVGASQFITLPRRYRVSALVTLELRLFKGLAMDVSSRLTQRRDQINLPRGAATEEEVLLRQRELATDYEYDVTVGFTYTFGSIFNNVVNPTMRGAGGF